MRKGALFPALMLAVLLLCSAAPQTDESLRLSQVMAELSRNPDFVEAVYARMGRTPKAGGILGPDEIKRLRELILGKDFAALDRFPGLTVRGMGRSVRLAAAMLGRPVDSAPPQPAIAETSVDDALGIPATGDPPTPDAYLRPLGFGLEIGDRIDPTLADRYADSLRLAEVLNRLSLNAPAGRGSYRIVLKGRAVSTPGALLDALAADGHDVEVRDSRYFANFGDLIYRGRDVLTPFWIDTELPVPGTDRTLLVPVSHSQHEFIVRGPVVNADLSFYFGIDGEAVFRPSVTRDQAWVMGRVAHRYRGPDAVEVTRLAGAIVQAYGAIKRRHPDLPFGGYYALGVCNDVNAMIELRMQGATTLFPLTLDPQFFDGGGEVDHLARRLPLDGGWWATPDPRRILGSMPVDDLATLPFPALRDDLKSVGAASQRDVTLPADTRDLALLGLVAAAAIVIGLRLVRHRGRHRQG
ncbi:hypothetical protein [Azospirillum canadense]|uniref:hypothetical protein n=1 Tax=Azospirillum canadense TaxID=403962 RepID=UPI0022276755|nr:hypothetical protein [Azospirillum canadense]MCW2239163.1 hypothetical protein [Azospirillum canadense]